MPFFNKTFSSPWWTSQSLTKASSFPINLSVFQKHVGQMPGGRPGMLMPSPRSHDKIANAPPPGLTTWANALRLPGGDGHRWNWLMHKRRKRLLNFVWNIWKFWWNETDDEILPVFPQNHWTLKFIFSCSLGKLFFGVISANYLCI